MAKISATTTLTISSDGRDAVIYRLVPSHSVVALRWVDVEAVPDVEALTFRVTRQSGEDSPVTIPYAQWGAEGLAVAYSFIYPSGGIQVLRPYTPAVAVAIDVKATSLTARLTRGGAEVDAVTVPFIADGRDGRPGEDVCFLDLDNEVEGIPCDAAGNAISPDSGILASANATVYRGASPDTGWDISCVGEGCTASVTGGSRVNVTGISADKATVRVVAVKDSRQLTAFMSLYKVRPGAPGESPVVYSIETTVSSISRDKDGTLSPSSVGASKVRTTGSSRSVTTEKVLTYIREGQDSEEKVLSGYGAPVIGLSATCTAVTFRLYDDVARTVILDRERVPVVSDGKDGDPGDPGPMGSRGPAIRGPQFWELLPAGYQFQSGAEGEEFIDVVIHGASRSFYSCRTSHAKASDKAPASPRDVTEGLWLLGEKFDLVATRLLLAEYALIRNLGVEALEMKDEAGNVLCEIKDGNVTCNTGTFRNVVFSGVSLKIRTEINAGNFNDYFTPAAPSSNIYNINLLKSGTWLDIKYVPDNPTYLLFQNMRAICGNTFLLYNNSQNRDIIIGGSVTDRYDGEFGDLVAARVGAGEFISLESRIGVNEYGQETPFFLGRPGTINTSLDN